MKVLYVSYDGMTDALGRSQVIPYLKGLRNYGHEIQILSCEKRTIPQSEMESVGDLLKNSGIGWHPLKFSTRPPWISKIADVLKIKRYATKLHLKEQFDIVHCRSYIAAMAGLDLKKKYGVKFLFDMRGFWANERIEGDMWNLSNPVYRFMYRYFKRKEKEFFAGADAVVSLTYNGKGVIHDLFGKNVSNKTTVIPCCVDTRLFSGKSVTHSDKTKLKSELGLQKDDFVLSYLGSTGTWYMTDEMLLFFKKLLTLYPHGKFFFISGDAPESILQKSRALGIKDEKIVVARATRDKVPLFLSLSDISIFFIRPVFSKKASSPTKQAEIMSMGIPLICNAGVGDTDMLYADEKTGLMLRDFSQEEFDRVAGKVEWALKIDPDEIRKKAHEHFNLDDGVARYHTIYQSIAGSAIARFAP